ncbi:PREDICTED: zinc finger CCCH domain-containing protein 14 [Tarenaya hassleriana]|uniref:zinc finger CCCH domain-containing protein 14 n=1 Tax=Tarenaya hassleriana TaxID=28532 RepID=UPI00053C215E|nr:PREDICTED: zinc finger CCCH domain-containing protein 14 [Tarenaya hassleriana]XP_010528505.1 PREDICTED: zinc finger CCCH domain-containing protein 14 [Tarenaya hassleriana]XP_010528506.1 PREDICTED: zinc finger CCCH domain-containing protein 14 [Tarenaya hassleriana]
MEKDASMGSDPTSVTTLNSPPPPLSPQSDKSSHKHQEEFAANFASLYQSIFSPESQFPSSLSLSPSPPSSSSPAAPADATTEYRLHQARLILEYNELNKNYDLCLVRLQSLTTELESLRQENAALCLENTELLRLIHLSNTTTTTSSSSTAAAPVSQPHVPNLPNRQQISDFGRQGGSLEHSRPARRNNVERTVLPKSISVRSSGYLRMNQRSHGYGGAGRQANLHRFTSQLGSDSIPQKVCVPTSGKGEKEAVELEVYRQGMLKTELCNKWQETGACPYGDNCQFAHGIDELRPVIRHPRYKTEVCRMIVTGSTCPYGHRCHFRHSLTEQERLLLPR